MSRIIVKGLPKYTTEEDLRKHFSRGTVTDVKLMKKRNGESRRFAFIGFKNARDASEAARYYHKSFIDTARIEVELAKTFADPTVPLSFREKRQRDEQRLKEEEERLLQEKKRTKTKVRSQVDEAMENDPKLREFMEVMKPSHQVKSWADFTEADGKGGPSSKELEKALQDGEAGIDKLQDGVNIEKESDDEYEDFGKKEEEGEEEEEMMDFRKEEEIDFRKEEGNENLAADEGVSDLDWLKARRTHMRDREENKKENKKENGENKEKENKEKENREKENNENEKKENENENKKNKNLSNSNLSDDTQSIRETGRLFIRNILYDSTEDDFRELFSPYGALEEVHIAVDTRTGKSKGFVYIQFKNPENAVSAYTALDKQIFQGRLLHILPGQAKKSHRLDEFDLKNLPLKKQRELKRKDQASKTQFSWNSLYMNTDAVLESVAAKMGVSKAQLADPESSSSAVKQALAEAHVIGDVRKYFEDRGVDLASFDKKERDDHVILVKNFAFGTTVEELGELFAAHGEIRRLLMPPAGTIAIVEFRDAPSARSAFSKLAYRRFKQGILYLEKGPKGLFTREADTSEGIKEKDTTKPVEAKITADEFLEDEQEPVGPTVSIFVKNLNFATTKEKLSGLFSSLPGFVVATLKTKADPKNPGKFLSMGFGFVEFKTKEDANAALSLDGHVLDGHRLQLKLSHRTGSAQKVAKSARSNKIIIKNLPFEATRKDLLELFGSFGQLKSVRVPKKFDKSARGFAFVEYNLLKEAETAMDQLHGVHLLGRRLVMQFAEEDAEDAEEEIERMTRKVRRSVEVKNLAGGRLLGKGKINLEENDEFSL